jgi:hypothetical protein
LRRGGEKEIRANHQEQEGKPKGGWAMTMNPRIPAVRWVLVAFVFALLGAVITAGFGPTAALGAVEGCPNEQVRHESDINPTSAQPYSVGLPECRAYEMVSPLEKQAHDATSGQYGGPLVSPDGQAVGYYSEGAIAEPENVRVIGARPSFTYIARRTGTDWSTEPAIVPASVITEPVEEGLTGDASPDLETLATCGTVGLHKDSGSSQASCASRNAEGEWSQTPVYSNSDGVARAIHFWGASKNLNAVVWQMPALQPGDTSGGGEIFETLGLGTSAPQLRLVSVDNEGTPLHFSESGGRLSSPYFGAARTAPRVEGSVYQAISSDGQTVFFEAEPAGGGPLTLYARTGDFAGGTSAAPTTVEIASGGTFVGASAEGSKVFFVTAQKLAANDEDSTSDLYEYDFDAPAGQKYIDMSAGGLGDPSPGSGANVLEGEFENGSVSGSVVAISPDGSHVYFHANSQLTTLPNANGEHASPSGGTFCYNTESNETQFVASPVENTGAQTTPDGRYLIFTTTGHFSPQDTTAGRAVYRYDFQTGEVTWISHAAPGFATLDEGDSATLAPREKADNGRIGAMAYYPDARRAISDDGEYVTFETVEKLQADDVNRATDVYLWHAGTVGLISDGTNPAGVTEPASMSATGSDIVYATTSQLVGQDTDQLQDIYDAKINGGFPAPKPEPACLGEACQGMPSTTPSIGEAASITTTPSGNLVAQPFREPEEKLANKPAQKQIPTAQKLSRAIRQCRGDKRKNRRNRCEKAARKRFPQSNDNAQRSPDPEPGGEGLPWLDREADEAEARGAALRPPLRVAAYSSTG